MIHIFIGISPRINERIIDGKTKKFININNDYLEKLTKLNLIPFILPYNNVEKYLSLCSGFIITGGEDINPIRYNEDNINSNYDDNIDEIDFKIIDYAYKNKIPLLGICRGHQIINVYFHGTLIQDYSGHYKEHFVKYKNRTFLVNSSHHQVINKIGKNIIPLFKCDDVIESIIHQDKYIVGVQWHPERMDDISSNFIFSYFKKEVLKYAQTSKRNKNI